MAKKKPPASSKKGEFVLDDSKKQPISSWAADNRTSDLAEQLRRESAIIAEAEKNDTELKEFIDAAFTDMLKYIEEEEQAAAT